MINFHNIERNKIIPLKVQTAAWQSRPIKIKYQFFRPRKVIPKVQTGVSQMVTGYIPIKKNEIVR